MYLMTYTGASVKKENTAWCYGIMIHQNLITIEYLFNYVFPRMWIMKPLLQIFKGFQDIHSCKGSETTVTTQYHEFNHDLKLEIFKFSLLL